MVGELLAEAVPGDDVILVGRPRNLPELEAFRRASGRMPLIAHLEAESALIDKRMAARGLGPIELQHPDALRRLGQALQLPLLPTDMQGLADC